METPKNKLRGLVRNPTPRLSERKKSLFSSKEEAQDDLMNGIKPLEPIGNRLGLKSRRRISTLDSCNDNRLLKKDSDDNKLEIASQSPRKSMYLICDDNKVEIVAHSQRKTMRLSGNKVSAIRRSPRKSPKTPAVIYSPRKQSNDKMLKDKMAASEEAEEQLHQLFKSSMKLSCKKEINNPIDTVASSNDSLIYDNNNKETKKRHYDTRAGTSGSPQKKVQRLEGVLSFPPKSISISTKSFYSNLKHSPTSKLLTTPPKPCNSSPPFRKHNRSKACQGVNKGVSHKIRRRPKQFGFNYHSSVDVDLILNNMRNEKLRNLITNKREEKMQIENVHNILKSSKNPIELAKPLSSISNYGDDDNNENNNNSTIYKNNTLEKKLDTLNDHDFTFSDIESESEDENENHQEDIQLTEAKIAASNTTSPTKNANKNRKFFKSDRSTSSRKEVKITDNIKASVCNGKIALVEQKKPSRKKMKIKNTPVNEFSAEQATVDAILKNLDDTAFGDLSTTAIDLDPVDDNNRTNEFQIENFTNELDLYDNKDYSGFRNRLPYNTNDPEVIEQQHLLLDFLINNNICTEENFTIFIADPDNHKEEASRIVDQVIVVVNEQALYRDRIPCNTNDPEVIKQQHQHLDFLIENNICSEENFDIFIKNYESRYEEAENIVKNVLLEGSNENDKKSRASNEVTTPIKISCSDNVVESLDTEMEIEIEIGNQNKANAKILESRQCETLKDQPTILSQKLFPIFYQGKCQPLPQKSTRKIAKYWGQGSDQYQIDAGQKNFGAQQCKHCGLVYTVHEPEEEKLHQEYHSSLYVLRFKGWIDEDIVGIYSEWGADGRIIRISDSSHIKRKERLADALKLVDKELGFSQCIIPKSFVAYFAVRKYQIVGLCLVQPLEKANKYMCVNGVDCCSVDEYDAKCGISRIWVAPLHRRMHIASKLIQAVQLNTIFGEEIPLNKIAFSAPTENGKKFAQKATKMENFLIYQ